MAKLAELSRKFKDISGEISALKDVSDSVKSVISGYDQQKGEKAEETENPIEINTISQLNSWISSVHPGPSHSVGLLMQAQLQALNNIETSILSGMVIDNILVCLHKAIEISREDQEKQIIRESFAALLQSVIFVSEARLQYDIKKNKEAAIQMLSSAGNLVSESVGGAATILVSMTGVGAVAKGAKAVKGAANIAKLSAIMPTINNIISPKILEAGVVSHLLSAKKKQEIIDERMDNHTKMLNNLFKTLGRYREMVGPSIQIHGMLSRYSDQLIEDYIEKQNDEVEKCTRKFSSLIKQLMDEMNNSLRYELQTESINSRAQKIAGFISSMKRDSNSSQENIGYDEVNYLYDFLNERYNSLLTEVAGVNAEIRDIQIQHKSLGIFQQSSKATYAAQLNQLEKKVSKLNVSVADVGEKVRIIESIILPVRKRIEDYSKQLNSIAESYAIC